MPVIIVWIIINNGSFSTPLTILIVLMVVCFLIALLLDIIIKNKLKKDSWTIVSTDKVIELLTIKRLQKKYKNDTEKD